METAEQVWSARDYERVARAIRFIAARATEQPSLAEVAAEVGLSEYHFHRLFREWAGITPKRFLQLLTLEHAKQWLEESQSVLEASFRAGLSAPSRLHDLFVTLEGVTPGEHRAGGDGVEIRWGQAATRFGIATIGRTHRGVCHLSFDAEPEHGAGNRVDPAPAVAELTARWPAAQLRRDDVDAREIAARLFEQDAVPVHVGGTNFQVQVWQALLRIPAGAVASYGDVAKGIGRPEAVRAVAGAIAANQVAWLIPCHRVIRTLGETGGYRWGTTRKRAMLAWEAATRA